MTDNNINANRLTELKRLHNEVLRLRSAFESLALAYDARASLEADKIKSDEDRLTALRIRDVINNGGE